MTVPELAKSFFGILDKRIGPFDRPIQFRPFPFDAGGAVNLLTVGAGRKRFVTYVSWDLFGHPQQRRGKLGRYELLTTCNSEEWCLDILTGIGRQSLQEVFDPGDTLDIALWTSPAAALQGVVFEEALHVRLRSGLECVQCGLLRCIGITRSELEFAMSKGTPALVGRLKRASIYPRTITDRESVDLRT
jgi:hypothetical protein